MSIEDIRTPDQIPLTPEVQAWVEARSNPRFKPKRSVHVNSRSSIAKDYVIREYFTSVQDNYVSATSKEEALDKVLNGEADETEVSEPYPSRPMTVRDVRLDRRFS